MHTKKFLLPKINRAVGITLVIFLQIASPGMANNKEEKLWQLKSQLVINHLADNYIAPSKGDIGKYVTPGLIAYRWRYKNADWQPKQWQVLHSLSNKKSKDFYTNSDAFKAPGMTRLLYLFPQDRSLKQIEQQYLEYLFPPASQEKKHNFWSSGGTENFVNMLRTSGYLLAQKAIPANLPRSEQRFQEKKQWLYYKARKTYQAGTAEWDSSSYTIFNLIGWLNLYDFAEDESTKAIAKAVLDYYASAIALKYTYGVYGGAEQRGGSAISSFNSYTDYLGWLWFSEYIPTQNSFFNWPQYIQLVYPATSSYRPPQEAILLARKQQQKPSLYYNSKANYGLARLETPEVFYIDQTYTLGTALVTNGEQIINWKLVSYPSESEPALVVTGSNSYSANQAKNGTGKTFFDRYLQHRNILVQMSYVPKKVKSKLKQQQFRQFIVNFIDKIPCGNTCRHLLRSEVNKSISPVNYPITKKNNKYYVSNYLSFPKNTEIVNRQGIYFVQLNNTYLAIFPFPQQPNLQAKVTGNRTYLEVSAPLDNLTGFLIEVGSKFDHVSFENFQESTKQNQLDLKQLDWEKVRYKTLDNQQLLINYGKTQTQATLKVDGRIITQQPLHLYQGENLQLKDRVLTIESAESVYQVNFQNEIPVFNRTKK